MLNNTPPNIKMGFWFELLVVISSSYARCVAFLWKDGVGNRQPMCERNGEKMRVVIT